MSSNQCNMPRLMPVAYEKKIYTPTVIIVDNKNGYTISNAGLGRRKGEGLEYMQIRTVFGLSVYCTTESIGIGYAKNGTLISLLDMENSIFFDTTMPDDVTVELVAALEITPDLIYIAAVSSHGTNGVDVVFASKIVKRKSLYNTAYSRFITITVPGEIQDLYNRMFVNYEYQGIGTTISDDEIVCDETYNEGHGFSSVTTILTDINLSGAGMSSSGGIASGVQVINNFIKEDVESIVSSNCILPDSRTIGSVSISGRTLLISSSGTKVRVADTSGANISVVSYNFANPEYTASSDNIVLERGSVVFPDNSELPRHYKHIFTKAGIFLEFLVPKCYSISRAESSGFASYDLVFSVNENGIISFQFNEDSNGDIVPSSKVDLYDPANTASWTAVIADTQVYATYFRLNFGSDRWGELGYLKGSLHEATADNGIMSIRSIQEIIEYQ